MAEQPRTQKQIALKYKDNLDYYRHGHFFRWLKLICFLLAVFGSLGAVFGFRYWGNKEFFNTGPISQNHARFLNNCEACHEGSEADLSRALRLDQAITDLREGGFSSVDIDKIKALAADAADRAKGFSAAEMKAAAERNLSPEKFSELTKVVIKKSSLAGMDAACVKCHDPYKLHQPQTEALALRGVHPALPLVHADRCSTCHREHVGHGRMKLPESESCATCHADPKEVLRTRNLIQIASPSPPSKSENRDIGDGLIRFLVPQNPNALPAVIKSYADGHPPFHYERPEARDMAAIKYNHQRHEQADIPMLDGRRMDCADCHQPGSGGIYYQPVKYEQHCAKCHSLHLSPDVPQIKIPHGDPEKVRAFLSNVGFQYVVHFMGSRGLNEAEAVQLAGQQMEKLRTRGLNSISEIERRVFYVGDPPRVEDRLSPRSNVGQFFPSCAKCHQVTPSDTGGAPKIAKTNVPDRWVHHGPFTHLRHRHMKCDDCHGAAHKSQLTTDILMPPQKLCVECHRPLDRAKVLEVVDGGIAPKPGTPEMAARQRREGGVAWDCQTCHKFHTTPEAIQFLEAKGPAPAAGKK